VTQLTLGYALEGCGRLAEARTAWQAVLRLEPYNAEASRRLSALATQQDHASGTPSPAAGGTSQRQIEPAPDSAVNGAATANPEAVFFRKTTLPTENGGADFMFAARGPVDESIVRDVCERDIYRLVDVKTPPQTILDIGAHIGCFSALAAHRWPKARIVACEPDLANYVLLDHHLKPYLARRQIEVVNKAVLGENVAETDFWVVADKAQRNSGGGSCCRQEQGASKARLKAIPIAQLWRDYGLTSCDLLKLDCEGSEYSILEGLRQAELLPRVGRIVGEWHCGFGRFERPEDAEAELRRLVGPTHKLEIEKRQGSREGHFVAERL
jgi:FkbM family methyltransferase